MSGPSAKISFVDKNITILSLLRPNISQNSSRTSLMFIKFFLSLILSLLWTVIQAQRFIIPTNFDAAIRELRSLSKHNPWNRFHRPLFESFFDVIFPFNESIPCERDMLELIESVSRNEIWALKIIDAWGKPLPSGLLKGNLLWTGNYDECLNQLYQVENKSFVKQPLETQYCTLLTNPSSAGSFISSNIVIGLCLPSTCNHETITPWLDVLLNNTNLTEPYLNCPNDQTKKSKDRLGGIITISFILSCLVLLVSIGTVTDIIIKINTSSEKPPRVIFLAEFSALRTLTFIFNMTKKKNESSLAFINGIRVLALFWIIFGHSFLFGIYYTSNSIDVLGWSQNLAFQLISSGVLSVDTFFVLSGFLTAVVFLKQTNKEKLSYRFMFFYYIHRYIRLTPTFILVLLISMYLTPYFGHGPVYPSEQGFESEGCHKEHYWWTSLLYIGNLVKPDNICLSVSWYLFNDMQFHWIAPLALIPFAKGRKVLAYIITTALILVGIGSIVGLFIYYPHISSNMIENALEPTGNTNEPSFFRVVYSAPWCRISPYAIGLLTGFITIHSAPKFHLHRIIKIGGSLIAIGLGLTCIFAMYGDFTSKSGLNRASIVAYEGLSRSAWGLAIGWLLFLCSINQGGFVNTILSWPIWSPLARLNYATYLIHLMIIFTIIYNQTIPFYYQRMTVMNNYVAQLFFSYLAAVPVVVFIEAPFTVMEKKLFKR